MMKIGDVSSVPNILSYGKVEESTTSSLKIKDSIELSKDALLKASFEKALNLVKSTSDIRTDKVQDILMKIEDPAYFNDASILEKTAALIADQLLDS